MNYILIPLLVLFSSSVNAQSSSDPKGSTYYFIRHAEKDRSEASNNNPHLSEKGKQRAEKWSQVFAQIEFSAIYTTDYNRTRETAWPTAKNNNLELTLYKPGALNIEVFLEDTKGKTVLIVGHSNTIPTFVNTVLGHRKYEMIADDNNANLYIVTVTASGLSDQLLVIE